MEKAYILNFDNGEIAWYGLAENKDQAYAKMANGLGYNGMADMVDYNGYFKTGDISIQEVDREDIIDLAEEDID